MWKGVPSTSVFSINCVDSCWSVSPICPFRISSFFFIVFLFFGLLLCLTILEVLSSFLLHSIECVFLPGSHSFQRCICPRASFFFLFLFS
ncbi:MAG: hypothetical protein [Microviridae sp.]|nr:MAG: hypothetical protein [Microviridae sp.]